MIRSSKINILIILIVFAFLIYVPISSRSQKEKGYKRIASLYEESTSNVGLDIESSRFFAFGTQFSKGQILEIWDMVDNAVPVRLNHPMALGLGIIWRKMNDGDIEWYSMSLDRGHQYVIVDEYGGGSRISTALYEYFIPLER